MRLCDFPILTFDTYGTLIDWETGHLGCAATALRASYRSAGSRGRPRSLRAESLPRPRAGQSDWTDDGMDRPACGTRWRRDSADPGGGRTGFPFQKHGGTGRPSPRRTGLNPLRRFVDDSGMRRFFQKSFLVEIEPL